MQNYGDFRFTKNGELVNDTTTTVGGTYSYNNYGENICVGYKCYETRYEDKVTGFPIYMILVILLNVVPFLYLIYGTAEIFWKLCPDQKIFSKPAKWVIRGVMWALTAGCVIALLVAFFTSWLPALKFAFQTI